ncbi:MAG: hypothetical protein Q4G66_13305 [bacterium]|nr:hypothetical protein [bacterium]
MYLHLSPFVWLILLCLVFAPPCLADWRENTGFLALLNETGGSTPDGKGVPVCLAESSMQVNGTPTWMLDPAAEAFKGKTIRDMSGAPKGVYSSHATAVGRLFFGKGTSMAFGVDDIDVFVMDHWAQGGGLRFGSALQPAVHECRVANHSWVGSGLKTPEQTDELLRRLDWWIDQDEYLHTVGLANSTGAAPLLLASAFNVISVGRSDGKHSRHSGVLDALYTEGRIRPDLVVPVTSTSAAAPIVAGAIALLLETAQTHPELSTDPQQSTMTTRAGIAVSNAGRAETIRAVLMAGADRRTYNRKSANIVDYRQGKENQSANGLDSRYGAGQLNIRASYHILMAGEQNSREDGGADMVQNQGFDYDSAFGGREGSNSLASYMVPAAGGKRRLTVALIWHLAFREEKATPFPGIATLYDLNLELEDLETGEKVAQSASTKDNSEHLWYSLKPGHRYAFRVRPAAGQPGFLHDYAVAWNIAAEREHAAAAPAASERR